MIMKEIKYFINFVRSNYIKPTSNVFPRWKRSESDIVFKRRYDSKVNDEIYNKNLKMLGNNKSPKYFFLGWPKFKIEAEAQKNLNQSTGPYHMFHMVTPSPLPFLTAISAFVFLLNVAFYLHGYLSIFSVLFYLFFLVCMMTLWFRDVLREAVFCGDHTTVTQTGLRLGFVLFIVSEIMFFFSFFWAFFHASLAPAVEIGCIWPPMGIIPFNAFGVPLLNTCILLTSGATITAAHHFLISSKYTETLYFLCGTVILALFFTFFQLYEYTNATFSINDSVYGSVFFMATGFHGAHVFVGTIFIIVCLIRVFIGQFSYIRHIGFEAAAWYWHFVDVVWLFLFIFVYWWGGRF